MWPTMSLGGLIDRAPDSMAIARLGLGATILLAGVHKLLAPGAWAQYVVGWLAPLLLVSPIEFMLINGVLEIGFGAALLADRRTALAGAVAAVSLTATAVYLAIVAGLEDGRFADVLVRDIGLAGLAWAVVFDALRKEAFR